MKSRKFNEDNFSNTQKSYKFQEKIALPFVVEKNVETPLVSAEDLRQSQNQIRHHKKKILKENYTSEGHTFTLLRQATK